MMHPFILVLFLCHTRTTLRDQYTSLRVINELTLQYYVNAVGPRLNNSAAAYIVFGTINEG